MTKTEADAALDEKNIDVSQWYVKHHKTILLALRNLALVQSGALKLQEKKLCDDGHGGSTYIWFDCDRAMWDKAGES
jgi:hypothetical protein